MNSSRLVSAIAALAVGFGITLVGTAVVGDDSETESLEVVSGDPSDESDLVDTTAYIELEETDEPDDASVGDDAIGEPIEEPEAESSDDSTDDAVAEPVDDATDEAAGESTDDEADEADEAEDDGSSREPSPPTPGDVGLDVDQFICEVVLVTNDGEVYFGDEYFVRDGEFVAQNSNERLPGFEVEAFVDEDEFGDVELFSCDTGEPIESPEVLPIGATDEFPCSDDAADGLYDFVEADVSGIPDDATDAEYFAAAVAIELASFGTASYEAWYLQTSSLIDGFADRCPSAIEAALGGPGGTFTFCDVANLSSDDRLLEFLQGRLTSVADCVYDPEGVN